MPPPVFEDWEVPIYQRVSVGLPDTAPPVPVDRALVDGDVLDFGDGAQVLDNSRPHRGQHRHPSAPSRCPVHRAGAVASFHRLAGLNVETACFGHGEPISSGAAERIREVAATLVA